MRDTAHSASHGTPSDAVLTDAANPHTEAVSSKTAGVSWRPAIRAGLIIWMCSRVFYLLLAWAVTAWRAPFYPNSPKGWVWPFAIYARYDSGHFIRIAQHGYFSRGLQDPNAAFFPGYALLGKWLSYAVGGFGSVTQAQRHLAFAIVAWTSAAVAAVLLWRLIAEQAGQRAATIGTLALLFGPYGFFFMADYSESPFLALALAAWLAGRRERWMLAGVLAGAAALFRIDGLFLMVGLIVMYALAARRTHRRISVREIGALALPVVVTAAYFGWLWSKTGHWDAWSRAEKLGWHRQLTAPWKTLTNSLQQYSLSVGSAPVHMQSLLELVFAALYVVVLVVLAVRRMWPELAFVGCAAAALMTSSFYQSVPRSFIIAFPVFLLVGEFPRGRRWLVFVPVALAGVALAVLNASLFVRGYFAG